MFFSCNIYRLYNNFIFIETFFLFCGLQFKVTTRVKNLSTVDWRWRHRLQTAVLRHPTWRHRVKCHYIVCPALYHSWRHFIRIRMKTISNPYHQMMTSWRMTPGRVTQSWLPMTLLNLVGFNNGSIRILCRTRRICKHSQCARKTATMLALYIIEIIAQSRRTTMTTTTTATPEIIITVKLKILKQHSVWIFLTFC